MNGIHDMGGWHGFGKVMVEPDEPVFHHRWEARVFGIVRSFGGGNIDAGRHSLEQLDPVSYLRDGYYGRWFAALVRTLIGAGVFSEADIEQQIAVSDPDTGSAKSDAPVTWQAKTVDYSRKVTASRLFRVGDEVVTRNHQPSGHTRLPAYARCKRGVVVTTHDAMVFPDDHAHGLGENPQYLYTVRFDGPELWGAQAEPGTSVHVDLFESYLCSSNDTGRS